MEPTTEELERNVRKYKRRQRWLILGLIVTMIWLIASVLSALAQQGVI